VKEGMQISLCIAFSTTFIAIKDEYEAKSYIMFTGKNKWKCKRNNLCTLTSASYLNEEMKIKKITLSYHLYLSTCLQENNRQSKSDGRQSSV